MYIRILVLIIISSTSSILFSQTNIRGQVTDWDNGEPLAGTSISIYKNGIFEEQTFSDAEGYFSFLEIKPGTYIIKATLPLYSNIPITDFIAYAGENNLIKIKLKKIDSTIICGIIKWQEPLIKYDQTTQGTIFSAGQLQSLPHRGN